MKVPLPGVISENKEEFLVYEGQEVTFTPLYVPPSLPTQAVTGNVEILTNGKKIEHLGIKIELIGLIGLLIRPFPSHFAPLLELYYDRGNAVKFNTLVRELEPAGILTDTKVSSFLFIPSHLCLLLSRSLIHLNSVPRNLTNPIPASMSD